MNSRVLPAAALIILVAALVFWVLQGANRGWTKTSVPMKTLDEVTGIEGITYHKRFVPGVDFLGAAFLGSAALAGASLLFRKRQLPPSDSSKPGTTNQ
jgi:hypothetical protein